MIVRAVRREGETMDEFSRLMHDGIMTKPSSAWSIADVKPTDATSEKVDACLYWLSVLSGEVGRLSEELRELKR
jgi:hypothetical protein